MSGISPRTWTLLRVGADEHNTFGCYPKSIYPEAQSAQLWIRQSRWTWTCWSKALRWFVHLPRRQRQPCLLYQQNAPPILLKIIKYKKHERTILNLPEISMVFQKQPTLPSLPLMRFTSILAVPISTLASMRGWANVKQPGSERVNLVSFKQVIMHASFEVDRWSDKQIIWSVNCQK